MSAPTTASIFVPFPSAMEPTPPEPIAAAMKWSLTGQGQPILLRICVPAAIEWMAAQMPGGWPAIMKRNRDLAQWASSFVESALGWKPLAPASMVGSMASLRMPDSKEPCQPNTPLYRILSKINCGKRIGWRFPSSHGHTIPNVWFDFRQLYNEPTHYHRLCEVMNRYAPSPQ